MTKRTLHTIATRWLLIGMLVCIVLAWLTACGAETRTGRAQEYTPTLLADARALIVERYPQAAQYKTVYTDDWPHAYAVFWNNTIWLTAAWREEATADMRHAACIIVHEYGHAQGMNEPQAREYGRECLHTI